MAILFCVWSYMNEVLQWLKLLYNIAIFIKHPVVKYSAWLIPFAAYACAIKGRSQENLITLTASKEGVLQ